MSGTILLLITYNKSEWFFSQTVLGFGKQTKSPIHRGKDLSKSRPLPIDIRGAKRQRFTPSIIYALPKAKSYPMYGI